MSDYLTKMEAADPQQGWSRWKRFWSAVDRAAAVVIFNGNRDETISQHAAVAAEQGKRWGCILCRVLAWLIEPDHCAKSLQAD